MGASALGSLTSGATDGNTAVGFQALSANTIGFDNTAIGAGALMHANNLMSPAVNTAVGARALQNTTAGDGNTAVGRIALIDNIDGDQNTALGDGALASNSHAGDNTAVGWSTLSENTTGQENTGIGAGVLINNTTGINNTAVGGEALQLNTGSNNVALGHNAGHDLTTGDNNIDIGNEVVGLADEHDTIRIGNTNIATTIIRGISGQTIPSGATVLVASNGQLGTMTSSERFKQEIKPMGAASEALLALKPVTFRYRKDVDAKGTSQFGLVAEEVEKINPDLVVRDEAGKPYSVRYDQVNAMLLNEFLKEHEKVEQQSKEIEALRADLKEQRALILQVNDKIEFRKSARQIVSNQP